MNCSTRFVRNIVLFWSSQRSCQTAACSAHSQSSSSHSLTARPGFRFRHWRGAPSSHCFYLKLAISLYFFFVFWIYQHVHSVHSLWYSWLQLQPSPKPLHEARKWVFLFFPFNPKAQNIYLRNLFPYYYSNISSENLEVHQDNILQLMTFFILVTCLFMLWGEVQFWLLLWARKGIVTRSFFCFQGSRVGWNSGA